MYLLGIGAAVFGGALIGVLLSNRKDKHEIEYIYVDTTGIDINPPKHYIEVEQNKTINFKLNKWVVSICHLPIKYNIKYIEKIKTIFSLIVQETDYIPTNKITELSHYLRMKALLHHGTILIYNLSKHFIKKKRGYKKALFKEALDNSDFIIDIMEQALDFWLYRKKKAQAVSQGQTLLSTVGSACTWNSLNLDSHGKRLIKPRYANVYSMAGIETTESKEKTRA